MARQGYWLCIEQERARRAEWVAYVLTALTTQKITPNMLLLGTEEAQAIEESKAEAEAEALINRMKRARES